MKLTNYILDLGRAVAFYPGLKGITHSTTATILLCQFLYWSDKSKDNGWIWKNSYEIEEETGLTYNEQRTARKILFDLNLLEENPKPLEHTIYFRIKQEELNKQWEEYTGKKTISTKEKTAAEKKIEEEFSKPQVPQVSREDLIKRGDLVDSFADAVVSPGMKKLNICDEIRKKVEKAFHVNTENNKKWGQFIEFVYERQEQHGEQVDIFLKWALREGFNPIYWTPEKMKTLWPGAFVQETDEAKKAFIQELPEQVESAYAPMPKDIGRKNEEI